LIDEADDLLHNKNRVCDVNKIPSVERGIRPIAAVCTELLSRY